MKALAGGLGFFSRIPVGCDAESYESLRKNLWILPIVGIIIGSIIAIFAYPLSYIDGIVIRVLIVLIYLAVEGINHIDGLADFADSIFAPEHKKFDALKDLKTGVGGVTAVCLYFLTLTISLINLSGIELIIAIINSQMMAKFGMLLLLTTTKPLWNGLASSIMEYASKNDLYRGFSVVIVVSAILSIICFKVILINLALLALCIFYRAFVLRKYGGVNGDIVGALNCIVFASGLSMFNI